MKKVLGFDQSYTSSGFVVTLEDGSVVEFGTFKTDKTLDVYDRARQVAEFVVNKVTFHSITHINIEGLAFGIRGDATRDLAGLLFVVLTSLRNARLDTKCTIVAPTSLKKFATGSGKSDKAAMIAAVPEWFLTAIKDAGYKKTTGMADIVDAYWLSLFKLS